MATTVDTSGRVLTMREDGSYFYVDDYGRENDVPSSCVVPPGVCERCIQMGRLEAAKVVHHIRHLTPDNIGDRKVTLSYSNLQRLCQDCHAAVHSAGSGRRVRFDESGRIIPPDPEDEFREQVMRLTETADEARNIHSGRRHG